MGAVLRILKMNPSSVPNEATGTAPEGGRPDGSAADELLETGETREVTGWDGTFEEAVDADVIPRPPPLNWNRWQRWRSDEGGGPTIDIDGYSRDARHEAIIYARVMRALYGANYRDAARAFALDNPDWEPTPPLYQEPEARGQPARHPNGKGKGKGQAGEYPLAPPLPVLQRASVAAPAADAGSAGGGGVGGMDVICLLYTSPSPRDKRQSRMPSSA